jgi:hypothetical protein
MASIIKAIRERFDRVEAAKRSDLPYFTHLDLDIESIPWEPQ